MKKKILIISLIILIPLFSFIMYQFIESLNYKSSLSSLNKYIFVSNETTIKSLEYGNKIMLFQDIMMIQFLGVILIYY